MKKEFKFIYHISDIHIRRYERMGEYRSVFKNLEQQLLSDPDIKDTLIIVAGDLVHDKIELSPESITLLKEFLNMLVNVSTVVLFAGNHDAQLSNKDRLDSLSPIIKDISGKYDLHYLKETNIYNIDNITFALTSVFDYKKIPYSELPNNNNIKIALFHGVVTGAVNDYGYQFTEGHFRVLDFQDYDLTILGDIHKHQFLTDRIAYSGSLIQQNFGESIHNHGVIKWDFKTLTGKFIPIKNSQGYLNLEVESGQLVSEPDWVKLPQNLRLKFKTKNTTNTQIQSILAKLPIKPISYVISKLDSKVFGTEVSDLKIQNIQNIEYQNILIKDFLNRGGDPVSEKQLTAVFELNSKYNNEIKLKQGISLYGGQYCTIEKLWFSNLFNYGEDNFVDFRTLEGVFGVFGLNRSGKTSLADIIIIAIFDKCIRAKTGSDILNKQKELFHCKIQLNIGGTIYFIDRVGKRNADSVSVATNFWYIGEDGTEYSLNGQNRSETNKIITSYVGNYDSFISTSVISETSGKNIVLTKQAERKTLVTELLGIEIFAELIKLANKDYNKLTGLIENLLEQKLTEKIDLAKETLKEIQVEKVKVEQEQLLKLDKLKQTIQEKEKLLQQKKTINLVDLDEESLLKEKKQILNQEQNLIKELTKLKEQIEQINEKIFKNTSEYTSLGYTREELIIKNEEYAKYLKQLTELSSESKTWIALYKTQTEELEQLAKVTYNTECSDCMNNPLTQKALKTKEQFKSTEKKFNDILIQLEELDLKVTELKPFEQLLKKEKELSNSAKDLQVELLTLDNLQEKTIQKQLILKNTLKELNSNLELIAQQIEDINWNKNLNTQIDQLIIQINKLETEHKLLTDKLSEYTVLITVTNTNLINWTELYTKQQQLEKLVSNYKIYLSAIGKNGVPLLLINQVAEILETETNNILNTIVPFILKFEVSEKNIDIYMVESTKYTPIELGSGFEKFIVNVAIKNALNRISNIGKIDFLIIDEGFGVLDTNNLSEIDKVFQILRDEYKHIMIITHLEELKDKVDKIIEIQRKTNTEFSFLV